MQHVEQRLNALEIKASFTEDLLEQLDAVVIRQQQQIDLLIREVTALRQPVASHSTDSPRSLRDDMPPIFRRAGVAAAKRSTKNSKTIAKKARSMRATGLFNA